MLTPLTRITPQVDPGALDSGRPGIRSAQLDPADASAAKSPANYSLNITVVYQGEAARTGAEEVAAQAAAVVGESSVRLSWWKMEQFSKPMARLEAAWMFALSDILIISMKGDARLPQGFHEGMMQAAMWRHGRRTLLVALLGKHPASSGQPAQMRPYLEAMATSCCLDFLLREPEWPEASPEPLPRAAAA
jgi:hypothetical protein